MYYLSEASIKKMEGVHPSLQNFMLELIRISPHDFKIVSGMRTKEEQKALYNIGRTTPGKIVTNCDGYRKPSNHQQKIDGFGYAIDIGVLKIENGKIVYKGNWRDSHYYRDIYRVAKEHGLIDKYKIEWAGNWTNFQETAHFQLQNARKVKFK